MADVELVIKIPEEIYQHYKKVWQKRRGSIPESCIAFGTPLPKGHGRIADIDKVLEEMKATRTYDIPFALERVKPIIEADTESEDKLDGDPIGIDKAVEHYEGTLEMLKGVDLEDKA